MYGRWSHKRYDASAGRMPKIIDKRERTRASARERRDERCGATTRKRRTNSGFRTGFDALPLGPGRAGRKLEWPVGHPVLLSREER